MERTNELAKAIAPSTHYVPTPTRRTTPVRHGVADREGVAVVTEARAGGDLPVGTVTFLLTDVEGSTALWETDRAAMSAAMGRHEEILSTAVAAHGGARPVEQGEGDNVVAAFARASDAAAAAIRAQIELAAEPWPPSAPIRVRMGLHTGEAHLLDGRAYAGPDLNRTARVRSLAHGGQVLVSRTTHDLLATHPPDDVTFRDVGEHHLKGIAAPEQVHQLCHPGLDTEFDTPVVAGGARTNMPTAPTPLVGRTTELAELSDLCRDHRLLTITGAGGSGKTRLAMALAESRSPDSPDGVWWIDLAGLADPDLVGAEVLRTVGERAAGALDHDAVARLLRDRAAMVVLDNAEHLVDACADLAAALLSGAPHIHVVATSREPLGVDGECTWRIPSLPVPADRSGTDAIAASPAVQLFVDRAARLRPGFDPDAGTLEVIARICRRLDGLPLGIELAAARVRMMSPAAIADGLDDRFRLLTGGSRRAVARQQTLQSSVEWSHDLLEPTEQLVFRRLSVFSGGFTVEAAEQVLADGSLDRYAVLDLVTRLVDKSLVVATGTDRFHLLETMRQYAHDRLLAADEVGTTRGAHLAWCLDLVETAEPELTGPLQRRWLDRLEIEHDNLRAAADWAWATQNGSALWRLDGSLTFFWVLHGHFSDAAIAHERALELSADVEESSQVAGRWGSAYAALYGGEFERAAGEAIEVAVLAEQVGDHRVHARALDVYGTVMIYVDMDEARRHLATAADLAERTGDAWCRADALQIQAYSHLMQDRYPEARNLLDRSGRLAHELESAQLTAWDEIGNSWIELRTGQVGVARSLAHAGLEQSERCGDPASTGLARSLLGEAAVVQGQAAEAIPVLAEERDRAIALGSGMAVQPLTVALAACLAISGDPATAVGMMEETELQFPRLMMLANRAVFEMAAGQVDLGLEDLDRTIDLAGRLGCDVTAAAADLRIAGVELGRGETRSPRARAMNALDVAGPLGIWAVVADAFAVLADVAIREGDLAEGARMIGAVDGVLARADAVTTPTMAVLGRTVLDDLAADAIDRAEIEEWWTAGMALSTSELLARALRSRGPRGRPSTGWDSLTPTELAVVDLLSEGLTNRVIGERLFISAGTVKTHLAHVYAKLGAGNRAEVAALAARRG